MENARNPAIDEPVPWTLILDALGQSESKSNGPVPQVRVIMDFAGLSPGRHCGDFVITAHILNNEDLAHEGSVRGDPKTGEPALVSRLLCCLFVVLENRARWPRCGLQMTALDGASEAAIFAYSAYIEWGSIRGIH